MYEVFGTECVYVPSQRAEGNHFKTVFCFVSSVPEVWIKRGGGASKWKDAVLKKEKPKEGESPGRREGTD